MYVTFTLFSIFWFFLVFHLFFCYCFFCRRLAELIELAKATRFVLSERISNVQFRSPRFWLLICVTYVTLLPLSYLDNAREQRLQWCTWINDVIYVLTMQVAQCLECLAYIPWYPMNLHYEDTWITYLSTPTHQIHSNYLYKYKHAIFCCRWRFIILLLVPLLRNITQVAKKKMTGL